MSVYTNVWNVRLPDRRRRHGVAEVRLACTHCGLVRWLPMSSVGTPHCDRGWFGFLLKGGTR